MAEIKLPGGRIALVDDNDAAMVASFKWSAKGSTVPGRFYAQARVNGRTAHMHRLITGAPRGMDIDHINGDGLDNRRANLRVVTHSVNMSNSVAVRAKSGFRGVYEWKDKGRSKGFVYELEVSGRVYKKRGFPTAHEAHEAYQAKRREVLGPDFVERAL